MHLGFSVHDVASFSTLFLNCKPKWKILGLYLKLWTASSVSNRYNLSFIHCLLFSPIFISDHSGYLLPLEETGSADCRSDGAVYSEPQSVKPPQNKPKDKTYDYAKPEGIIVLTASRTSLDNLDSLRHAGSEHDEADYVQTREADGPSSPIYTTVQGPNSPRSPGASSEEPLHDNKGDDSLQENDYIEVLPDSVIGT